MTATRGASSVDAFDRPRSFRTLGRAVMPGSFLGLSAALVGMTWTVGPLNMSSALLVVALAAAVIGVKPSRLMTIRIGWFDWVALGYAIVVVLIENINAGELGHAPSPGYAYGIVYYLLAYVVARITVTQVLELRMFLIGLTWPGIVVAIIGVLQLAGFAPIMSFLLSQTTSSSLANRVDLGASIRATSTIGHWTALGAYLAVIVTAACVLLIIDRRQYARTSRFAVVVIVICGLGVVSTVTFASILVVGVVVLVSGYMAGVGVRITATIGVVGAISWLVFGAFIGERVEKQSIATAQIPPDLAWLPQTLGIRIVLWTTEGIPAWLDRVPTGWGLGVWRDAGGWSLRPRTIAWPSPESEWIKSLVGSGLIGFIGLLVVLLAMHSLIKSARRGSLGTAVSPVLALFWGMVVASFIAPYFTNQGAPALLWPLVGAIAWAGRRSLSAGIAKESTHAVA